MKLVLGLTGAAMIAFASSLFAAGYFFVVQCGELADTGGPFPAERSPQGRVCGHSEAATWLEGAAFWSIPLCGLIAVILVGVLWRRGGVVLRTLGVAGLVVLPLVPLIWLGMPADTCSAGTPSGSGCETTS